MRGMYLEKVLNILPFLGFAAKTADISDDKKGYRHKYDYPSSIYFSA